MSKRQRIQNIQSDETLTHIPVGVRAISTKGIKTKVKHSYVPKPNKAKRSKPPIASDYSKEAQRDWAIKRKFAIRDRLFELGIQAFD